MIEFFARHPTAGNLLMFFLVVIGLSALPDLQRETLPDFAAQRVQVSAVYPGAGTEDVEERICQRLEEVVDGINDVTEVQCTAREGVGSAVIEMAEGGDMDRFLDDIKAEVEAIDTFPDEVEIPTVKELDRTSQVVSIAVTGPMSESDLKAYAEQLKDRMQLDSDISQVEVIGFSDHQLRIEVTAAALRRYGLSISDIKELVARQGIDLPAGGLETQERDFLVRFKDQRRDPAELAELIVVTGDTGSEVRLGDVARISDRFELDEEKTLFNGRQAAILQVVKNKQQDALVVADAVNRFLDEARQTAPPGVTFAITQDRSTAVRDRLNMLTRNGAQGLVLVFLVMWLFFQGRFAFWVAMGLPVSFLGALFFMGALGLTINMITMVALLIAIGLLMDDAIVIAENIATHLRRGKSATQAAIDGTRQVSPGVISSFLTSIAVFAPLASLSGHMGKVLQFIPMVLILVLAVSLIEAFLILPHHLARSLKHHEKEASPFRQRFDARLYHFRDQTMGRVIDFAIHQRYWFVGGVIALFLLSVGMLMGGYLKFQPFPNIEGDTVEARIMLPPGTPLWRTEQVVQQVTTALQEMNKEFTPLQQDARSLVENVQVRFNHNQDAGESGAHLATVTADLITAEEREGNLSDMTSSWRQQIGDIPDILLLNIKEPTHGPAGIPIELRLAGPDLKELKAASLELQEWLRRYEGTFDISDNLRPGKPELQMRLRDGALALGVDASTIASQLRAAFYGAKVDEIQVGRESFEIDVRLAAPDQDSLAELEEFRITTNEGAQIPLSAVAIIEQGRGYSRIQRIDGLRTVTVSGDLDHRIANAQEIIRHTRENFLPELQKRFPSVLVKVEGQARRTARTGSSMARAFSIGLILILILLSFQFRSYAEPLVVMSVIPLALIGVIWGHMLLGLNLSMPSVIGFASLSGVVVNDSILLVEFLKLRVREGLSVVEAAKQASRERFRAVLLTSITTMAGLVPLLLERSLQAQILIPLAASIVFGLFATTLLVLLLVPSLFSILNDFGISSVAQEGRKEALE
jgi:multidrug efflux pump subunit AcrB